MRHVVSAYVSKSRCGSTTEASLGGTENLASSFGFSCQTPEPPAHEAMRESALNSQVPALSVPPRRPPRQAPMFKREFYFNDLSSVRSLKRPRRSCSAITVLRHYCSVLPRGEEICSSVQVAHDGCRSTLPELRVPREVVIRSILTQYPQASPAKRERMFLETVAQIDTS